ncbi:MAG: hypothetical protein AAF488_11300 [Planctomycetota bacterium]
MLLWVIGQLFRDAHPVTAIAFYVPPTLVLLPLCVGFGFRELGRGSRHAWGLIVPGTILVLFVWRENPRFAAKLPEPRDSLRAVHWNVMGASGAWGPKEAVLQSKGADVYALSESYQVQDERFLERWPGYSLASFGSLSILVRGTISSSQELVHTPEWQLFEVRAELAGRQATIWIADLKASLLVPRAPALAALRSRLGGESPDLLLGDFNAPRRSRALDVLPPGFTHAYRAVGSGFGSTWPAVLPLYAIDQCIFGSRIDPIRYELESTLLSDHRIQIFDFVWRSAGG